jgi:hypothetical protein
MKEDCMIKHSHSLSRATLFAVAMFPYLLAAGPDAQTPGTTPADGSPITVVDGKRHIELLGISDPSADVISGNWKQNGTAADVNAPGRKSAQLEFPYAPPAEYDYCVTFEVQHLSNLPVRQLSEDCWIGDHRFTWVIRGDCNAIRLINGKGPADKANPTNNPLAIEPGKQYVALIEIRKDRIRATLNGNEAFDYKPATTDFSEVADKTALRLPKSIGLHIVGAAISIKSAAITEVTGEGTLLRGGPAARIAGSVAVNPSQGASIAGSVAVNTSPGAGQAAPVAVSARPGALSVSARVSAGTGDSEHFIDIPAVKWGTKEATAKQQLLSGVSATSISLKPFDDTLVATSVGPSRITLQTKKISAVGELKLVDAGVIEMANGKVTLQWAPGDQSAAWGAIRYALLELRDQPDSDPTVYSMSRPVQLSVMLNQPKSVALGLPATVTTANVKFSLQTPSNDWQSTNDKDGDLTLSQNGLEVLVKRDQAGGVLASCSDADPTHAQKRLDALNRQKTAAQTKLAGLKKQAALPLKRTPARTDGVMVYPATVEDRTALNTAIKTTSDDLDHLSSVAIPKAQADLDAAGTKAEMIAQLDGTKVVLVLPNGIVAVQITLQTARK